MKKIIGCYHLSMNDANDFYKKLCEDITKLQEDGQEIEIQYSTQDVNDMQNPIEYSALIIGRK